MSGADRSNTTREPAAAMQVTTASRRSLLTGASAALIAGAPTFQKPPLPWWNGPRPTEPVPPNADAELIALAAEFHRLDAQLRPWGTEGDTTPDETYQAIQAQWWEAANRIEAMPATSREGLAAKASIIAPVINDTASLDDPTPSERIALSVARDLGAAVPPVAVTPSPDAELIAVCDRLVALEARYDTIYLTIADDDGADRAAALLAPEFAEAERQLHALDLPRTLAGQQAFARAALASAQRHADGSIILDDGGSMGSYLAFGLARRWARRSAHERDPSQSAGRGRSRRAGVPAGGG